MTTQTLPRYAKYQVTDYQEGNKDNIRLQTEAPDFPRRRKNVERKIAEGHCWAITQAAKRSCCGGSGSSVLECGSQLDSLVHTHTADHSQCLLNCAHHRHLHCPTNTALTTYTAWQIRHLPPAMPGKYSTYHLHYLTNTALTIYTARQIQQLTPTLPDKYSTYNLHCPTNIALTTYIARQIQQLPPTLPDKYSTYHLHCPTNIALTTYTARQIQHLPPTLPTNTVLTILPTNTALTNYNANKYNTYHPITMALLVPLHLIIHLYVFYAYRWKLTLLSGTTWVGFFPPPLCTTGADTTNGRNVVFQECQLLDNGQSPTGAPQQQR